MAFHIELRVHWQYDHKGYQKVKGSHTINYSKSTPILLMKPH
jgi:hypothetical protein